VDARSSQPPLLRHEDHARTAYLDGWRGVSILLVLIGHFTGLPAIRWGQLGVELFFALSGRLMAQILFVDGFPLRPFFARRFSRVWPGLLVLVLVLMALSSYGWPPGEAPIDGGTALATLGLAWERPLVGLKTARAAHTAACHPAGDDNC